MYNFLKNIFGIPSDDSQRTRRYDGIPPGSTEDEWRDCNNPRENIFRNFEPTNNEFGFNKFNDIHNFIENFIGEMERSIDIFGFSNQPTVTWENESNLTPAVPSIQDSGSLRDSYLKSPGSNISSTRQDIDLDGKFKVEDVEQILNNKKGPINHGRNSTIVNSPSNIYSKSVYIRTIRHPDGSVETIKKVCDHNGKEETTITHDNSSLSPQYPIDNASDLSIFKKFFPF